MTYRLLLYFFIGLLFSVITNCKTYDTSIKIKTNDTTEVFRLLLNKDFLDRNMPGFGALSRPNPFNDTIIFKSDIFITHHIPERINGFIFKFLTQDQICNLALLYQTDTIDFPNFFELRRFQKIDTLYDVALQVTCVIPSTDTDNKCYFGMLCGGGLSATVYKQKDTLIIRKESSWSD